MNTRQPVQSRLDRSENKEIHALFLNPLDIHQHPIQPKHTLLQRTCMLCNLTGLCRRLPSWLALDHDIKIYQFVRQSRHVVLETE